VILARFDASKTYAKQKKFDCGNDGINRFVHSSLKKQVRDSLSSAVVLLDDHADDRFAGFYTLTSFSLHAPLLAELSKGRLPNQVPCVRMVMLGVDRHYQGQRLGRKLLQDAIARMLDVAESIGVYGLYLDADPPAVDFYLHLGFIILTQRHDDKPSPMFLPIETAKAALP
jgi:GNAT superfamily N-acetyltransferase